MEALALLGGKKLAEGLPIEPNFIGDQERKLVNEVLDSGELSGFIAIPGRYFEGGRMVRALQDEWCTAFGSRHAIAVNSATTGLHAAVVAAGVEPGDEVIVSPLTMAASGEAILLANGVPVFADTLPDSLLIDPEDIKRKISPRTKAIMVVHLCGHPCDMDPIMEIARQHKLVVIADNAQAPGAMYKGRYTGVLCDMEVFSLNRHKTIQCGEGGVITTDSDDFAMKCKLVRNHGDKVAAALGYEHFNHVGMNYRMTELEAAVARAQLAKLEQLTTPRIEYAEQIAEGLRGIEGISPPPVQANCRHVYYIYHMRYDAETVGIPLDLFAKAIAAEGFMMASRYGAPIYTYPIYQHRSAYGASGCPFRCPCGKPGGEVSYAKGICPTAESSDTTSLWTNMTAAQYRPEHIKSLVNAFHKVLEQKKPLLAAFESGKLS